MAQDIVNNVSSANSVGVKFDACGRSFTYKANSRSVVIFLFELRLCRQKMDHCTEYLDEICFSAGIAELTSAQRLIFFNKDYHDTNNPSSFYPGTCGDLSNEKVVQLRGRLGHVKAIKIGIRQMLKGSVPSIASLDVWGKPSRYCRDGAAVRELQLLWDGLVKKDVLPVGVSDSSALMKDHSDLHSAVRKNNAHHQIPECLLDPLVLNMMEIPILLPSGYTIDQKTLDKHVQSQAEWGRPPSDPFTGLTFNDKRKPVVNAQLKMKLDSFMLLKRGTDCSGSHDCEQKTSQCSKTSLPESTGSRALLKRHSTYSPKHVVEKKQKTEPNSSLPSSNSIHSSLEDALITAKARKSRFRPLRTSLSTENTVLCCCFCGVYLISFSVKYCLPCGHKLCRECSLQQAACTSVSQNDSTKACPTCQATYGYRDVKRTYV